LHLREVGPMLLVLKECSVNLPVNTRVPRPLRNFFVIVFSTTYWETIYISANQ
jgi:hypothetical protein